MGASGWLSCAMAKNAGFGLKSWLSTDFGQLAGRTSMKWNWKYALMRRGMSRQERVNSVSWSAWKVWLARM
jgi:hypothetical protein